MKLNFKHGVGVAALAVAMASTAAIAAGGSVGAGTGGANEIFGRAAGMPTGNGASVRIGKSQGVGAVDGRGSQIPAASPAPVDATALGIEHFGRGSMPATVTRARQVQGETIAQTR